MTTPNTVISACCWTPEHNGDRGLPAARSNQELWGGWIFVSDSAPGYVAWFGSEYGPTDVMRHPLTKGHTGRIQ